MTTCATRGSSRPRPCGWLPLEELEELVRPAGYYRLKSKTVAQPARLSHGPLRRIDRGDGCHADGRLAPRTARGQRCRSGDGRLDLALRFQPAQSSLSTPTPIAYWPGTAGSATTPFITRSRTISSMNLKRDVALYNEYHALLVRVGNNHCRKTPKCDDCPLRELLPEGGPLPPD